MFRSTTRSSMRSSAAAHSRPAPRLAALAVAGGVLLASFASVKTAGAAPFDRELFTWSGRVDREVYITMRGRDIRTTGENIGGRNRVRVNDALPRGRGDVQVRLLDGRGDVDVIEQPSARNNYTVTVRVRDPRSGDDSYRLMAYWSDDDRFDDRRGDDRRGDRRDERWDDRRDRDNDCAPRNNGRGWGWGRGGRGDCDNDRGQSNRGRNDRDDRGAGRTGDDAGTLRWSGRVDDVVELRISGRRVDAITRSGQRVEDVNSNIRGSGLPSRDVTVMLDRNSGRGSVQVVQQPSSWNGYTAVIRIYDPQGGASFYDFSAYWSAGAR